MQLCYSFKWGCLPMTRSIQWVADAHHLLVFAHCLYHNYTNYLQLARGWSYGKGGLHNWVNLVCN